MSDAHTYGQYRWAVILTGAKEAEYLFADAVRITETGALVFESADREDKARTHLRYAYAPGQWREVFAASMLDGHAVAME